jgi:hypothetical protein
VFRDIVLEDGAVSEAECIAEVRRRNATCQVEVCEPCRSECTYPSAAAAADVLKCTVGRSWLGFSYCASVSDAGQLAQASHGADRGTGYIAVPERVAAHLHGICHYNPTGRVQRDAVSCRAEHRNSPTGRFVPGFDAKSGNPVAREGYMVGCKTSVDCRAACGEHPLTGEAFVCMQRWDLYDVAETDDDGGVVFRDLDQGSGNAFDPDEGGGICVDMDYSLQQNCRSQTIAGVVDGVGCFDGGVGLFLCGLNIDVHNSDVSTAAIDGEFSYPRTLVEGGSDGDGDGLVTPAMSCDSPVDCVAKCDYLKRTSAHGAGTPPTCSLCDSYCSSNVLSAVTGLVDAISQDIITVTRVLATCFGRMGLQGCVCQLALSLQPTWRKVSTNKEARCENGDPFEMLVSRIEDMIQTGAENLLNSALIDPINDVINGLPFGLGRPIDRACFATDYDPKRCEGGPVTLEEAARLTQCEHPKNGGLDELCFFARVREICGGSSLSEYTDLFSAGHQSASEAEAAFEDAVGESFAVFDPTMAELFRAVEASAFSGPDLAERRDICSSSHFAAAMGLDLIIISCFFSLLESTCASDAASDESFDHMLSQVTWKLPVVRLRFDVSPPPPPPATFKLHAALVEIDPHGFQLVRAKLEEIFPLLEDVATSAMGASVGPYLPDFDVSPHVLTKAFLSSRGMRRGALGARVVESKHTGRWRPGEDTPPAARPTPLPPAPTPSLTPPRPRRASQRARSFSACWTTGCWPRPARGRPRLSTGTRTTTTGRERRRRTTATCCSTACLK